MQKTLDGMTWASASAGTASAPSDAGALGWRGARAWKLLLIERRDLIRGCLELWLNLSARVFSVISVASAEAFLGSAALEDIDLAVLSVGASGRATTWLLGQVGLLRGSRLDLPIVVIGDGEDHRPSEDVTRHVPVRGYVPTSTNIDVAVAALHLIAAGGRYTPAEPEGVASAALAHMPAAQQARGDNRLTPKEMAVLDLLEGGLANKNIAFQLSMSESTVKVHVRNIMKKLHARNRTEAAVIGRSWSKARAETDTPHTYEPRAAIGLKNGKATRTTP